MSSANPLDGLFGITRVLVGGVQTAFSQTVNLLGGWTAAEGVDGANNPTLELSINPANVLALAALPLQGDFGSGADGNLVAAATTTTLTRDTYYDNITLTGTARINTNGWKLFWKGVCDLSGAQANAIHCDGNAGGAAAGLAAGAAGAAVGAGSLRLSADGQGIIGSVGTNAGAGTTDGTTNSNTAANGWGGNGGAGAIGGATATGGSQGGQPGTGANVTTKFASPQYSTERHMLYRGALLSCGAGGGTGGAGRGGSSASQSGASGGSGGGGGCLFACGRVLTTGASTPAECISANGGKGGNGAAAVLGGATRCGGGAGSGGGGGGLAFVIVGSRVGAAVANLISCRGGNGGNGGDGAGAAPTGIAGGGGGGGAGGSGQIRAFNLAAGVVTAQTNAQAAVAAAAATSASNTAASGSSAGAAAISF